jgi:hypothetical protein
MELNGLFSNPRLTSSFGRLVRAIAELPERQDCPLPPFPRRDPRPGEIVKAVKEILSLHPEGLRTIEVRAMVEELLGRKLRPSTTKTLLADHPAFDRIRRGVYRLR